MSIEFDKYQKFGAYHWKSIEKDSLKKLIHFSLPLWSRYQIILKYLSNDLKSGAEIGCGDGVLSFLASQKGGLRIIGCDTNSFGISFAKEKTNWPKNPNLDYKCANFGDLNISDSSLDFIMMADVIEHLENPETILAEIFSKLKPGGKLLLTTPYKKKQGKWDVYHITEFDIQSLSLLLGTTFKKVHIKKFQPIILYKIYNKYSLIKFCFNLISLLKLNPFFLNLGESTMLFAICTKQEK